MKLTKIVATVGPACAREDILEQMILHGVNVFRFNLKHNELDWHAKYIQLTRKISKRLGIPVGILTDLQGPSIRINLPYPKVDFDTGELLPFGDIVFEKNIKGISISHPQIIPHLKNGQEIFCADGTIKFIFKKTTTGFFVQASNTATLFDRKNVSIPGSDFPLPTLIENDYEGIKMSTREHVDFIALSFVRSAADIRFLRDELTQNSSTAKIVSKIETLKSIDLLDEVLEETDVIMIARGDLGVEIPLYKVPYYQKVMISRCIEKGIPVITATQMIESMMHAPQPTRAEISDIANATYDLTDAVMLSGESAFGKFPLEAITMMAQTVEFNEPQFTQDILTTYAFETPTDEAEVVEMAYNLYLKLLREHTEKLAGFIVFTHTGKTARLLSRYRPIIPIYAFCPNDHVSNSLTISFGVFPGIQHMTVIDSLLKHTDIEKIIHNLLNQHKLEKGDKVIVVHGDYWGKEGGTNTVKLITV